MDAALLAEEEQAAQAVQRAKQKAAKQARQKLRKQVAHCCAQLCSGACLCLEHAGGSIWYVLCSPKVPPVPASTALIASIFCEGWSAQGLSSMCVS